VPDDFPLMQALAPILGGAAFWLLYFDVKDSLRREPRRLLLLGFALGVASTGIAWLLYRSLPWIGVAPFPSGTRAELAVYCLAVAGPIEEGAKFLVAALVLFRKDDSLLFKKKHIAKAHAFYERYGGKTIVIARFVPIVRTFAPTVAGAAGMDYGHFLTFNVVDNFDWVASMLLLGYWGATAINSKYGAGTVEKYLHPIIFVVIFLSILPAIVEVVRERRRLARERALPGGKGERPAA